MKNKNKKTSDIRGQEREDYFNDGLPLSNWRGKHIVHKNKKDKRKNRKIIKKENIDDSNS